MGPPPPPSASYLWKFDDTDDDDDDEKGDLCERFPMNHNNNHHLFHHQKNDDRSDNNKPVVKADTSLAATTVTTAKHSVVHQMIETTQTNLSWSIEGTGTGTGTSECINHNDKDTHSIDSRDDDDDFHNDGDDDGHDSKKGTNQKKRKKSKKKRKKKISSSSSPNTTLIVDPMMILPTTVTSSTTFTTTTTRHHVTFSCVTIHTFARCFGRDVVPTHGGWPLGMEYYCQCHDDNNNNVHDDHDNDDTDSAHDHGDSSGNHNNDNTNNGLYSIDEYETEKRERLQQRHQKLVVAPSNPPLDSPNNQKSKGPKKTNRSNFDHNRTVPDLVLETRQWDYKNRQKNPLFGILHESDRMNLLQSSASNSHSTSSSTVSSSSSPPPDTTVNETTNRHHPSSSGRRTNHHNHQQQQQQQQYGDRPSASNDNHHHTNIYTSTYVNSIRNALEQLRIDRSTGIGCQCRKLQVPILSTSSSSTTNTSNKKGHHPKRLKLQKLKDELTKRQLVWSEEQSREEMEQILHDAVEQEPCCLYTDTCFCARNGIGCQADVCSCWHRRHHLNSTGSSSGSSSSSSSGPNKSQKGSSSSATTTTTTAPTIQEIQERCGNPVGGMYVVDDHHIDTFRNDYLQRLKVCPFISVDES